MVRAFPWDEVVELIEDSEPVAMSPWRHGTRDDYVFEKDGEHWRVTIDVHHEEGWQPVDPITAIAVVQRQKTITEWVRKPDAVQP